MIVFDFDFLAHLNVRMDVRARTEGETRCDGVDCSC